MSDLYQTNNKDRVSNDAKIVIEPLKIWIHDYISIPDAFSGTEITHQKNYLFFLLLPDIYYQCINELSLVVTEKRQEILEMTIQQNNHQNLVNIFFAESKKHTLSRYANNLNNIKIENRGIYSETPIDYNYIKEAYLDVLIKLNFTVESAIGSFYSLIPIYNLIISKTPVPFDNINNNFENSNISEILEEIAKLLTNIITLMVARQCKCFRTMNRTHDAKENDSIKYIFTECQTKIIKSNNDANKAIYEDLIPPLKNINNVDNRAESYINQIKEINTTVICGRERSGKTTIMHFLMKKYLENGSVVFSFNASSWLESDDFFTTLIKHISKYLEIAFEDQASQEAVKEFLVNNKGNVYFFLDDIDLCNNGFVSETLLIKRVNDIEQILKEYPQAKFCLFSREEYGCFNNNINLLEISFLSYGKTINFLKNTSNNKFNDDFIRDNTKMLMPLLTSSYYVSLLVNYLNLNETKRSLDQLSRADLLWHKLTNGESVAERTLKRNLIRDILAFHAYRAENVYDKELFDLTNRNNIDENQFNDYIYILEQLGIIRKVSNKFRFNNIIEQRFFCAYYNVEKIKKLINDYSVCFLPDNLFYQSQENFIDTLNEMSDTQQFTKELLTNEGITLKKVKDKLAKLIGNDKINSAIVTELHYIKLTLAFWDNCDSIELYLDFLNRPLLQVDDLLYVKRYLLICHKLSRKYRLLKEFDNALTWINKAILVGDDFLNRNSILKNNLKNENSNAYTVYFGHNNRLSLVYEDMLKCIDNNHPDYNNILEKSEVYFRKALEDGNSEAFIRKAARYRSEYNYVESAKYYHVASRKKHMVSSYANKMIGILLAEKKVLCFYENNSLEFVKYENNSPYEEQSKRYAWRCLTNSVLATNAIQTFAFTTLGQLCSSDTDACEFFLHELSQYPHLIDTAILLIKKLSNLKPKNDWELIRASEAVLKSVWDSYCRVNNNTIKKSDQQTILDFKKCLQNYSRNNKTSSGNKLFPLEVHAKKIEI